MCVCVCVWWCVGGGRCQPSTTIVLPHSNGVRGDIAWHRSWRLTTKQRISASPSRANTHEQKTKAARIRRSTTLTSCYTAPSPSSLGIPHLWPWHLLFAMLGCLPANVPTQPTVPNTLDTAQFFALDAQANDPIRSFLFLLVSSR